jgi:hypothetical protein
MTQRELETWRPALIAFLRVDSPWMVQKLQNLSTGAPLTEEDKRIIQGLKASRMAA